MRFGCKFNVIGYLFQARHACMFLARYWNFWRFVRFEFDIFPLTSRSHLFILFIHHCFDPSHVHHVHPQQGFPVKFDFGWRHFSPLLRHFT